jgi:hypothetical protein
VFQSLASAVSLKSRPLNDSSSFLCRKKRGTSLTEPPAEMRKSMWCRSEGKSRLAPSL